MLTVSFQGGNIEMVAELVSRMTKSDTRTVAKGCIALFSLFVVFPGGFVRVFWQSSLVSTLLYIHQHWSSFSQVEEVLKACFSIQGGPCI